MIGEEHFEKIKTFYRQNDSEDKYDKSWGHQNRVSAAYWSMRDQALFELLSPLKEVVNTNGRVLEIGSGFGHELIKFTHINIPSNQLFGIDLMQNRLKRSSILYPGIRHSVQNGCQLAYRNESFEVITQFTCFFHMPPNVRRTLYQEVRRVLKPGGVFLWWDITEKTKLTTNIVESIHTLSKKSRLQSLATIVKIFAKGFLKKSDKSPSLPSDGVIGRVPIEELKKSFEGYEIRLNHKGLDYDIWNFIWKRNKNVAQYLWMKSWFYQHLFGVIIKPAH